MLDNCSFNFLSDDNFTVSLSLRQFLEADLSRFSAFNGDVCSMSDVVAEGTDNGAKR